MTKPRWQIVAERALRAPRPRLSELVEALDLVNPTPHAHLKDAERIARYRLKGELQTLLIEAFPDDLELRCHGDEIVLGLIGGGDAKHVVPHKLGESAQDWLGRELIQLELDDGQDPAQYAN